MRVHSAIIIAGNALYRKIIRGMVQDSKGVQVTRVFSNFTSAESFLRENDVSILIIDPHVCDKDWFDFCVTCVNINKSLRFFFALDKQECYSGGLLDALQNYQATLFYFDAYANQTATEERIDIDRVMRRYDQAINRLLLSTSKNRALKVLTKFEQGKIFMKKKDWKSADIVLIASSTGGPSALEVLFQGLRQQILKPILLVQHMPEGFTSELCKGIEQVSGKSTMEGYDGLVVEKNQVIVAPGSYHMMLRKTNEKHIIGLTVTELVNGVRPAADVLFKSVAKTCAGKNVLVLVLTGMGSDGLNGIMELKKSCNCYCITQSEKTSVVYGMPRAVVEAGLCDEIVDIEHMHKRVIRLCKSEENES